MGEEKGVKWEKHSLQDTCTAKHESLGYNSSKAMTVSSLSGKRLELLRTWMSYLSQHLWCSDQCSLCKEEPWAQKCLLTSTAPPQAQGSQALRSWWAEIPYKLLSLLAPPEGQKGHSSAVASIPFNHHQLQFP